MTTRVVACRWVAPTARLGAAVQDARHNSAYRTPPMQANRKISGGGMLVCIGICTLCQRSIMLFYMLLRGVVAFPLSLHLFLWNSAHKSDNVRSGGCHWLALNLHICSRAAARVEQAGGTLAPSIFLVGSRLYQRGDVDLLFLYDEMWVPSYDTSWHDTGCIDYMSRYLRLIIYVLRVPP